MYIQAVIRYNGKAFKEQKIFLMKSYKYNKKIYQSLTIKLSFAVLKSFKSCLNSNNHK